MELNYRKRNQEKTKTKVWNFNDPLGGKNFACSLSVSLLYSLCGRALETLRNPISFEKCI